MEGMVNLLRLREILEIFSLRRSVGTGIVAVLPGKSLKSLRNHTSHQVGGLFRDTLVIGLITEPLKLPICSPWTFRENHSTNIIYTVNRRNQPTAMDLYFLDWVRTRYKTKPETHTKSAHTVL